MSRTADHHSPSPHVKITILKPPPPKPLSEGSKLAEVLRIPTQVSPSIPEDFKGETDLTETLTADNNIRRAARGHKIMWQATTPDPGSKVHYVNVATAAPITPKSTGTRSTHLTPNMSTTPSPVEPSRDTFTTKSRKQRTSSKSMHDFTELMEPGKLPLVYQPTGTIQKPQLVHANTHYRLSVPKQTVGTGRMSPESPYNLHNEHEKGIYFSAKTMKDTDGNRDSGERRVKRFTRSTL